MNEHPVPDIHVLQGLEERAPGDSWEHPNDLALFDESENQYEARVQNWQGTKWDLGFVPHKELTKESLACIAAENENDNNVERFWTGEMIRPKKGFTKTKPDLDAQPILRRA